LGRKRRKVIKITKRRLPKVFSCPQCGMASIRVDIKPEEVSKIACGSCGLTWEKVGVSKKKEAIDLYNEFIDQFMTKIG
jgi:transcription elongation factor Elf1